MDLLCQGPLQGDIESLPHPSHGRLGQRNVGSGNEGPGRLLNPAQPVWGMSSSAWLTPGSPDLGAPAYSPAPGTGLRAGRAGASSCLGLGFVTGTTLELDFRLCRMGACILGQGPLSLLYRAFYPGTA